MPLGASVFVADSLRLPNRRVIRACCQVRSPQMSEGLRTALGCHPRLRMSDGYPGPDASEAHAEGVDPGRAASRIGAGSVSHARISSSIDVLPSCCMTLLRRFDRHFVMPRSKAICLLKRHRPRLQRDVRVREVARQRLEASNIACSYDRGFRLPLSIHRNSRIDWRPAASGPARAW